MYTTHTLTHSLTHLLSLAHFNREGEGWGPGVEGPHTHNDEYDDGDDHIYAGMGRTERVRMTWVIGDLR